jgi:hypothetical protein
MDLISRDASRDGVLISSDLHLILRATSPCLFGLLQLVIRFTSPSDVLSSASSCFQSFCSRAKADLTVSLHLHLHRAFISSFFHFPRLQFDFFFRPSLFFSVTPLLCGASAPFHSPSREPAALGASLLWVALGLLAPDPRCPCVRVRPCPRSVSPRSALPRCPFLQPREAPIGRDGRTPTHTPHRRPL